jgi:hypothetical protein
MNTLQTFTYAISSVSGIGALANDEIIDIGPLRENYDSYYVKCIAFTINGSTLLSPAGFYHLVADDWAENGYYGLRSNQAILATLNTVASIASMTSGEGSHFIVKNMRVRRQIRFRLYLPTLLPVPNNQVQGTTQWNALFLFTPII